jgi:hypothetical protein
MQRTSIWFLFLGFVGLAAFLGCAEGTDPGAGLGESELATLPVEAGKGDENSVVLPPSTKPTEEEDAAPPAEEEDAGGTDSGGGTDAGAPDAAPDSGGGGTGTCASANTCAGSTDLGAVSGDTGADVKTAQGSGSQWFTVHVTEDDSNIFGLSLLAKAELTSPPGTNFDLFMYVGGSASSQSCSGPTKSSTSTGADSTVAEFGESSGGISNGKSDERLVTVEVRWVSGTCLPTAKWSLTVRGNTP